MTTVTDDGLDWVRDRSIGDATGEIDRVAVGTATDSESQTADALGSEQYSATTSNNNVEVTPLGDEGDFEVSIEVTGGTEVSAGTEITEMGVEVDALGELIAIDNFDAILVESGNTEQFTMVVPINR